MLHDPKKEATIEEELFHAGLRSEQRHMLEAAEIIKQHGWCQGSLLNARGQVCLLGAFQHLGLPCMPALNELALFIVGSRSTHPVATYHEIIKYNDTPGQTMPAIVRDLQYCALG
jgi:hypothetical protein